MTPAIQRTAAERGQVLIFAVICTLIFQHIVIDLTRSRLVSDNTL